MKRLMALALTLSLMDAVAALAQDQHRGGGHPQAAPGGGFNRAPQGRAPTAAPVRNGPMAYVPQGQADRPHVEAGPAPYSGPAATHLGHGGFGAPGFQPGASDRPRYSPQYFPPRIQPNQRYHWSGGQGWAPQPGYYNRRWRFGEFLPFGWFASSFWISDWGDYDLPVPPYGYEWVRVGPDALLVDTYTGEVVSSVYGLFY